MINLRAANRRFIAWPDFCFKPFVYLEFYGLTHAPFDITPNPRFLFHSSKHREAFNHLLYGIRERKGFVQLTGEVGAGKTTLCRALLEQLDSNYSTALILNPVLNPDEMMKAIAMEFGLDVQGRIAGNGFGHFWISAQPD